MTPNRLLALYHRIAPARQAIDLLRDFTLDLAVRGSLVAQDPTDEPASELLKRVVFEKARRENEGTFQEPRSSFPIDRRELPFCPPTHWSWTRLIDIARPSYGFAFKSSHFNSGNRGMPLIRIRDISRSDTEAYFQGDYDPAYVVHAGDYLVGMDGDFKLRRWGGKDALLNQRVMRINGWSCGINPEFVKLPLQMVLDHLHGSTSLTTVKHLSAKQVNGIEIPLPPLAEQDRIVAKVDDLMTLCHRLQKVQTRRERTRNRLTKASLVRLSAPDPNAATFSAHVRFAVDSLPALTARSDQLQHLRDAILDLAVHGKLVEQDPADEPASALQQQVASGKEALKRTTRDARIKPAPDPRKDDFPVPLPPSWGVQSFENLFLFIDYRGRTPPKTITGVPLITAKNVRSGTIKREPREFVHETTFKTWMTRGLPKTGDLFFTTEAPLGNVCVNNIEEPFALAQRVICLRAYGQVNTRYFMFAIMSDVVQNIVREHSTGLTAKGIKAAKLKPLPLPIPPLEEQHRIVAKVDQLMAICDRLEQSLRDADSARSRLLEAILYEALGTTPEKNAVTFGLPKRSRLG